MKSLLIWAFSSWYATCAVLHATNITGRIAEQRTKYPLEFADVALYRAADSVFVTGNVTDADGRFAFAAIEAGTYYVEYSFIGFETHRSPAFKVGEKRTLDIGTFYLARRPSSWARLWFGVAALPMCSTLTDGCSTWAAI